MSLSVENLAIAVILILPGFLSALVRARHEVTGDRVSVSWLGLCLLRSLVFNLVAALLFSRFDPRILDVTFLSSAKAGTLPTIEPRVILLYVILLYAIAYLWGHAPVIPLLRWVHARLKAGGTIDPDTSVFRQTLGDLLLKPRRHGLLTWSREKLAEAGLATAALLPAWLLRSLRWLGRGVSAIFGPLLEKDEPNGLWLLVRRSDGRRLLGKVAKSSATIESDSPFEMLLSPVAELDKQGLPVEPSIGGGANRTLGLYFRIQSSDEVHFFLTSPGWLPPEMTPPDPNAGTP